MDPPGTQLKYQGVVESGAPLAIWRHAPVDVSGALSAHRTDIELPLKPMPPLAEIEARWRACEDPVLKERLARQRAVRKIVGDGTTSKIPLWIWRVGDAVLIGQPNEAYSVFQPSSEDTSARVRWL